MAVDLTLDAAVRTGSTLVGGVIRRATSLIIPWTYTQTVDPTDTAIGTAVLVQWYATLNGDGFFGPNAQTTWFGPRGVFELEGVVSYGADQSFFAFAPVGYADLSRISNDPGSARVLAPSWSFLSSRMVLADDGAVTLTVTDVNRGGAALIDSHALVSLNNGSIDGVSQVFELTSVLSAPVISGDVHISRRVAVDVQDLKLGNSPYFPDLVGSPTVLDVLRGNGQGLENADDDTAEADEQVGIRVHFLANAGRNIGIENASATVETSRESTLSAAGSTVRIDLTTVALNNTSGASLILTSTPTLAAGLDGQRITLINTSANSVIMQDDGLVAGTSLRLGAPQRVLESADSIDLRYKTGLGWVECSRPSSSELASYVQATNFSSIIIPNATWTTIPWSTITDHFGWGGSVAGSTTIASGSNGAALPQSTINVSSASSLPSSGCVLVAVTGGLTPVTYAGKTSTTLTGCTGGVGTLSTGASVAAARTQFNMKLVSHVIGRGTWVTNTAGVRGIRVRGNLPSIGYQPINTNFRSAAAEIDSSHPMSVSSLVVPSSPAPTGGNGFDIQVFQSSGGSLAMGSTGVVAVGIPSP